MAIVAILMNEPRRQALRQATREASAVLNWSVEGDKLAALYAGLPKVA